MNDEGLARVRSPNTMRRIAITCLLLLGLVPSAARADTIPADLEMAIHLKILSFDAGLKERATGSVIVIGIVHPPDRRSRASDLVNATAVLTDKNGVTVHGKKVRAYAIPYGPDLADRISGVSVLYAVEDLSSDQVSSMAGLAFARKMPLLTGARGFLSNGAAVAVISKDNKPSIVVHAGNAKSCGMVLDSKLLRLAEVVK
jgi:hypothetical protein